MADIFFFSVKRKCFTVLAFFPSIFSFFHSLHSSSVTGDRMRKRKERQKKSFSITPFSPWLYYTTAALSTRQRKRRKKRQYRLHLTVCLFLLYLTHSRHSKNICFNYSRTYFLHFHVWVCFWAKKRKILTR